MRMSQIETKCATEEDELDLRIAHELISGPRKTDQEIAKNLGVSRRTISRRRNSDAVKELFKTALELPETELRRLLIKGLKKIEEHMDDANPKISLMAASQIAKLAIHAVDPLVQADEKEELDRVYTTSWGNRTEPGDQ
jgi:transcriptional regulator with XRE-family HTH domain